MSAEQQNQVHWPSAQWAWVRAGLLVALVAVAFHSALTGAIRIAMDQPEAMHVFIAPALIALLLWRRRETLWTNASAGSVIGVILLALSLAAYQASLWRWVPEYVGSAAMVAALGWAVATAAGWKVMWACVPALLLVMLALPPGSRYMPFFLVADNPATLPVVQPALGLVTDVPVEVRGDEILTQTPTAGMAPLAQLDHRTSEAMLLLGYLSAAVVVGLARPRRCGATLTAVIVLAIPVAALCHIVRTFVWSAAILRDMDRPGLLSARAVSAAVALALAFGLLFVAGWVARQAWRVSGHGEPAAPETPEGAAATVAVRA